MTGLVVATVVMAAVTSAAAAVGGAVAGMVVVIAVVGTSVTEAGVAGVVPVSWGVTGCDVHPLAATSSTTRMKKPIYVFMK